MDILIGADPEVFVKRKDTGALVSGYGLIPGTKHDPHKVKNGAVQVDGMALEFNINPAENYRQFKDNINSVMGQLTNMIGDEYELAIQPVAHFGREYIDAQPEVAKELGCDPDFNAYRDGPNPRPNGDLGFRTASGHIHIGWTNGMDVGDPDHVEACRMLVKQLDYSLASMSNLWDRDTERRNLYGELGTFRPKHYGVEYRVLSNAWLTNKELWEVVYRTTENAVHKLLGGKRWYEDRAGNARKNNFFSDNPIAWHDDFASYTRGVSGKTHDLMYKLFEKEYDIWNKKKKTKIPTKGIDVEFAANLERLGRQQIDEWQVVQIDDILDNNF